jgi:hypothetical protein
MLVRVPNAMTVNRVGSPLGTSEPFPVALRVERHSPDVVGCYIRPAAMHEIMDLLVPRMLPFSMLTDVGTYDFVDGGTAPLSSTLAGYGVDVVAEDSNTVIVATPHLLTLFGDLQTYNFVGLDLPAASVDLPETWCVVNDGLWPVLPRAPESTVFLSSHDDAYVWVETREPDTSVRLCQRALAILVGSHLLDGPGEIEVVPPPGEIVAEVLGEKLTFGCQQQDIRNAGSNVRVPFNHLNRKLSEPPKPPTCTLVYGTSTGDWEIEERDSASA